MKKKVHYPSVSDVAPLHPRGTWQTKSGGILTVPLALEINSVNSFLSYDQRELSKLGSDIRGLRVYLINGLRKSKVGANEFHKLRKEIIISLKGQFQIDCDDLSKQSKSFAITEGEGLIIPNYIIHAYTCLSEDGSLLVIANTIFDSDNPDLKDTYDRAHFDLLRTD